MKILAAALFLIASPLLSQNGPATPDPFKSISFLEGTWDAKANGSQGVAATGSYTFALELGSHILARHSTTSSACKRTRHLRLRTW